MPEFVKKSVRLPFTDEVREYWTEKVGHYYIYQGDIIVDDDFPKKIGNVNDDKDYVWTNAQIPVEIDPALPQATKINCIESLNWLNRNMEICFRNRVDRDRNYIFITFNSDPHASGSSYIGMQGGKQVLFIDANAGPGTIMHELLHASGLHHEQSRSDRDEYVKIIWDNIIGGAENEDQYRSNFEKSGVKHGRYDIGSIMHYGPTAFGKGNPPAVTIKRRDANGDTVPADPVMGQRNAPSTGDIAAIKHLYRKYSTFCDGFNAFYDEPVDTSVRGTLAGEVTWRRSVGQPKAAAPVDGKVDYLSIWAEFPNRQRVTWDSGNRTVGGYSDFGRANEARFALTHGAITQRLGYEITGIPANVPIRVHFALVGDRWGGFPPAPPPSVFGEYRYELSMNASGSQNPRINPDTRTAKLNFTVTGEWIAPRPHIDVPKGILELTLVESVILKQDWVKKTRPVKSFNMRTRTPVR